MKRSHIIYLLMIVPALFTAAFAARVLVNGCDSQITISLH